jgi:predicted GIY-YIG superfamily endonuclease
MKYERGAGEVSCRGSGGVPQFSLFPQDWGIQGVDTWLQRWLRETKGGSMAFTTGVERFRESVRKMPKLLRSLEESEAIEIAEVTSTIPKSGVYVFYENSRPIYVGRSNNMRTRLRQHGRESSGHNQATFAFMLAKEQMKVDKKASITRGQLEQAPGFKKAFYEARRRVREMKIRFIPIDDQIDQALFEIYAALALGTPYNDFGTH